MLEDAPAGIAAGRAAGMTVWAVTTTHAPGELGDAHRIARGLPELLAGAPSLIGCGVSASSSLSRYPP